MGRTSNAQTKLMKAVMELIWKGSYAATTIDQICAKARVQKGTFYYFYKDKADLAIEALEHSFVEVRTNLNRIFDSSVSGIDRIRNYCESAYNHQLNMRDQCGRVLGCPLVTLGSELTAKESKLRLKVQSYIEVLVEYFEKAIRDAANQGHIEEQDSVHKARMLLSYFSGLLIHARIQNDLTILRDMLPGALTLLKANDQNVETVTS